MSEDQAERSLEGVSVMLDAALAERVRAWSAREGRVGGLEAAVATLLDAALTGRPTAAPQVSDGERLLLRMLGEVHAKLEAEGAEARARMMRALENGHLWALEDQPALSAPARRRQDVEEVRRTLTMYRAIANTVSGLPPKDRDKLAALLEGKQARFAGYDPAAEADFLAIAEHLIQEQELFVEQAGVSLAAGAPMRGAYVPMLRRWDEIAKDRALGRLSVVQLADLLQSGSAAQ